MKYFELTIVYLSLLGFLAVAGYTLKDSHKATKGIEQHLIERGLR